MRARPHFWVSEREVLRALVRELRGQLADAHVVIAGAELRAKQAEQRASELANALTRERFEKAKAAGCYSACITPFMGRAEAEAALERRQGFVNRGQGDGEEAR